MKVLSFSAYDDLGGAGWNTATAFNRHRPDWTYRAVRGAPSYLQFPEHTAWDWGDICRWFEDSDVVHLHDGYHAIPTVSRFVCTYHGVGFREQPAHFLRTQTELRATGLVSTLDLWLLAPDDVQWAPAAHDLDWYAELRSAYLASPTVAEQGNNRRLRIGHAPTDRGRKNTAEFLTACERIAAEHPIDVVLIEGVPWREALALKATCDVFYDQVAYGYGGSAIEAWGMGQPVVCGAHDTTLEEYRRRFGYVPFVEADAGTIEPALRQLLDPYTREVYAARGRAHVERFHSYPAVVDLLEPIYRQAAGA